MHKPYILGYFIIILLQAGHTWSMKKFSSPSQQMGELGEHIAVRFLVEKGFSILERNFTRKWGEIDIIAQKLGVLRFIEVKSVSCENFETCDRAHTMRPEDHMSAQKQERLSRTIEIYMDNKGGEVGDWQFDLLCVYIDRLHNKAKVCVLENLILE
jgi:putative endonuclease